MTEWIFGVNLDGFGGLADFVLFLVVFNVVGWGYVDWRMRRIPVKPEPLRLPDRY